MSVVVGGVDWTESRVVSVSGVSILLAGSTWWVVVRGALAYVTTWLWVGDPSPLVDDSLVVSDDTCVVCDVGSVGAATGALCFDGWSDVEVSVC